MTTVTLHLPNAVHSQVADLARERGESLESLVQDVIEAYLEDLADTRLVRDFEARRTAGTLKFRDWSDFEHDLDRESVSQ